MKDYEYQAYVCNKALYDCLVQIKASGVPEEDIKVMLRCIGETLIKMEIDGKPIDYYIKHAEEYMRKRGNQ